jgi:hypothetical protein
MTTEYQKRVFSLKIKDKHLRGRLTTRWKQQITRGGEGKIWKETLAEGTLKCDRENLYEI